MATGVDICNLALTLVGSTEFLGSLEDEDTTAAKILSVAYAPMRNAVLERLWWPFATKQQTLAVLEDVTRDGWLYACTLPSDLVSPQYLSNGMRRGAPLVTTSVVVSPLLQDSAQLPYAGVYMRIPFSIEEGDDSASKILLTDINGPVLVYTAEVDEVVYSHQFVEALSHKLAARLAYGLLKKPLLGDMLDKRGEAEIQKAWASILRSEQEDVQPDSEFIAVRE